MHISFVELVPNMYEVIGLILSAGGWVVAGWMERKLDQEKLCRRCFQKL